MGSSLLSEASQPVSTSAFQLVRLGFLLTG
jgi:hypothetical protein